MRKMDKKEIKFTPNDILDYLNEMAKTQNHIKRMLKYLVIKLGYTSQVLRKGEEDSTFPARSLPNISDIIKAGD